MKNNSSVGFSNRMTLSQYVSNNNYFTSMKDWKKQHKDSLDFYICMYSLLCQCNHSKSFRSERDVLSHATTTGICQSIVVFFLEKGGSPASASGGCIRPLR